MLAHSLSSKQSIHYSLEIWMQLCRNSSTISSNSRLRGSKLQTGWLQALLGRALLARARGGILRHSGSDARAEWWHALPLCRTGDGTSAWLGHELCRSRT